MDRLVRFVVHQRISGDSRQVGLFTAAYHLRDNGELTRHDRERLGELLTWFEANLTVPPKGSIRSDAIFWYVNVGVFSERMWELVQLLKNYDFTAEQITASFVGRLVYQDTHQVAALPSKRRHR